MRLYFVRSIRLLLCLSLFTTPVILAAAQKTSLLVLPLSIAENGILRPQTAFATNASAWLSASLSGKPGIQGLNVMNGPLESPGTGETTLDRDIRLGKKAGADKVLSGYIDLYDGKLMVRIRVTDTTNKKRTLDDQVYTYNLTNQAGLQYAVSNLALRIPRLVNGVEPEAYIEPSESTDNTEELVNGTNSAPLERAKILRQLSLVSLDYHYPTGFDLTFIETSYNWLHPVWPVGIGLGSCLVRMALNLPGYAAVTGTILPVQLSVPVLVNPDKERITDLVFRTEWAWYAPINISGSATNTNSSFFLDNPVNYLDFRLSFYFTGFSSVNAGCMWLYNTGNVYFYAGATVFLGFYTKE
jgi:hypothetical protein